MQTAPDDPRSQHLVARGRSHSQITAKDHSDIESASTCSRQSGNKQRKLALVSWSKRFRHRRRTEPSHRVERKDRPKYSMAHANSGSGTFESDSLGQSNLRHDSSQQRSASIV